MEAQEKKNGGTSSSTKAPQPRQVMYTEFLPTSVDWTQEADSHVLRIGLPGFLKEDLNVQVDSSGKLTVRGKRHQGTKVFDLLEQVFDVPKDAAIDKIYGKLDRGCLTLIMPTNDSTRRINGSSPVTVNDDIGKEVDSARGHLWKEVEHYCSDAEKETRQMMMGKGEEEVAGAAAVSDLRERIMEKIHQNRKVLVVAAVAFTFGYCVARSMRST